MKYRHFVSPETQFHHLTEPLQLESGEILEGVQVAYRTWGQLAPSGDNGVLICHALTGWADADVWWEPLFGKGKTLDPSQDFIVCANILGSCYGTTGPITLDPQTNRAYGPKFPAITIRDIVRTQASLLQALGVRQLKLAIGGSLGGMQVLEWALLYPDVVGAIVPIAVSGKHSAWCIGLSEAQRQAIYADPHWQGGYYDEDRFPIAGLAAARMVAMCTYRSRASFEQRFGREEGEAGKFEIASYLQHQGEKLVKRFDPNTYIALTRVMDTHDLARGRGEYEPVLRSIQQPALIVAIDSDILYPPEEQQELVSLIPNARLASLNSLHGHDAFLIDMLVLDRIVKTFRDSLATSSCLATPVCN